MNNNAALRVSLRLFGAPETRPAGLPLTPGNRKARVLPFGERDEPLARWLLTGHDPIAGHGAAIRAVLRATW